MLEQIIDHILANSYLKREEIPSASAQAILDWYRQQVAGDRNNEQNFLDEDIAALEELAKKERESI